ncbi:MAG TPA: hypothetical protein VIK62_03040 [Verrucomicrobiae bacterium]
MIQDWANDNSGFIDLNGNLAAVGQRHLAIQNQIQQIAALQNLAEAQRRQQMEKALLEDRQNILYDISAALEDVKQLFKREPDRAYYEFLLLENFVSSLSLEHRMFPNLEWKNHCNKTVSGISELRSWCDNSLDTKSRESGLGILEQRKLQIKSREDEGSRKLEEEQQQVREEQRRIRLQKNFRDAHKFAYAAIILFTSSLITFQAVLTYYSEEIRAMDQTDSDGNESNAVGICVVGLLLIVVGLICVLVAIQKRNELEINDRKLIKKLIIIGLVIGTFSGLIVFLSNIWHFLQTSGA